VSTGLDFTSLARVRSVLGFQDDDRTKDADLSRLIRAVSGDMEDEMRRFFKVAAYTEILDLLPPNLMVVLSGTPVLDTPAPVVELSNTRDFTNDFTTLVRGSDFVLENDTGKVRMMGAVRGVRDPYSGQVLGPAYVRVQYTGGAAETQYELEQSYPRIAEAAELQVAYEFQRQKSPGGNVRVGAGSTDFGDRFHEQGINWLPLVRRVLEYHKRRSVY